MVVENREGRGVLEHSSAVQAPEFLVIASHKPARVLYRLLQVLP